MAHGFHRATIPDRSTCVLLAEDDLEMRHLLAARLRAWGVSVIEVSGGDGLATMIDALLAGGAAPPPIDLIISDIRMPGFSGLELLHRLRVRDRATPMILMTGFGDAALHEEATRLGADAVFDKPFDIDDLCTAVVNLVGS